MQTRYVPDSAHFERAIGLCARRSSDALGWAAGHLISLADALNVPLRPEGPDCEVTEDELAVGVSHGLLEQLYFHPETRERTWQRRVLDLAKKRKPDQGHPTRIQTLLWVAFEYTEKQVRHALGSLLDHLGEDAEHRRDLGWLQVYLGIAPLPRDLRGPINACGVRMLRALIGGGEVALLLPQCARERLRPYQPTALTTPEGHIALGSYREADGPLGAFPKIWGSFYETHDLLKTLVENGEIYCAGVLFCAFRALGVPLQIPRDLLDTIIKTGLRSGLQFDDEALHC